LSKIFIAGVVLGLLGAGGLTYSLQVVDLHREPSHITVAPNGGNVETFRVDLPRDRILVGLAGEENALPAELEWPSDPLFGDLQAEMFHRVGTALTGARHHLSANGRRAIRRGSSQWQVDGGHPGIRINERQRQGTVH
jgi:hypothetical protein